MSLPEPLRFTVGLVDQISKPLGNIRRQMNQFTEGYRDASYTMASGAAGMVASGYALQRAMMPAIEMDRALGEVKSLGVADDKLKQLTQTALKFSVEYGKSATEFVGASYQIKSAMGELSGEELTGITRSSAILAAATKADTETITNYMGTMYTVYQNQANAIGKDKWVEQVAGMTAKSVEMFKTTGQGMSDAFKSVGALGKSQGIAIQEQMSVLGLLQGSMSGSEAGTRYKAFLNGVVKAQDQLGMAFTDSNGKMLPMYEIMNKLRNQFGDLDAMEIAQIKKAFGSDEAVLVVTDLINKTKDLQSSVSDLNEASTLDTAINMAKDMTDQWERMEQGIFAIRTAFGAALLPSLVPVLSSLADGAGEIIKWTELFPNLTKYIGYATLAFFGLAAAGGAATLMMGIGTQVMLTWSMATKVAGGFTSSLLSILIWLNKAISVVNLTMMANPIMWVVAGIAAAIAAVGALIYYWDDLRAAFGDTVIFQAFDFFGQEAVAACRALFDAMKPILTLIGYIIMGIGKGIVFVIKLLWQVASFVFKAIIQAFQPFIYLLDVIRTGVVYLFSGFVFSIGVALRAFSYLFKFVSAGWKWVLSGFQDVSGFDFLFQITDDIKAAFDEMFAWLTSMFDGVIEEAKDLVSWIPGLGDDDEQPGKKVQAVASATPRNQVQRGGAARAMASYQTNATHYGGVNIYAQQMNNPQDLATELEMNTP